MFVAGYQLTPSPPALSMLFKVIGTDTDWSGSCDILLVIHSHHRPNLYRFRGKGRLRSKQAVREAATICPAPCKLTFDLLTLKVVSESRVTWATVRISPDDGLESLTPTTTDSAARSAPRAGSGVVRMDPLRFLAGCRTMRLNQV